MSKLKKALMAIVTSSLLATAQCASITGPGPFPSPAESTVVDARSNPGPALAA